MKEIIFLKENSRIVFAFRKTLSDETDRGCALMAASFLENELERVLRLKFAGTKKQVDELFEFNGPLGTFSSKIKLSYCIGIINKQTLNDLDLVRRIRNEFGHNHNPIDFTTERIKRRIDSLQLHYYEKEKVNPRKMFTNAVSGNLALIHSAILQIDKFSEQPTIDYTSEMKKEAREPSVEKLKAYLSLLFDDNDDEKEKTTEIKK